jgi:hypothetical protein
MTQQPRPASCDEFAAALAHVLTLDGHKHWHRTDEILSQARWSCSHPLTKALPTAAALPW